MTLKLHLAAARVNSSAVIAHHFRGEEFSWL